MSLYQKLDGLPLRSKILLLCAAFTLPVVVLLYAVVSAYDVHISMAKKERMGTQLIRPTVTLMTHAAKHRASYKGSPDTAALVASDIENDFAEFEKAFKEVGPDLLFSTEELAMRKRERFTLATLKSDWESIQQKIRSNAPTSEVNESYRTFIADLKGVVAHAGDTSQLMLDPDLDSYYLMDAVVVSVPQIIDRLDSALIFIENIATKIELTQADLSQLAIFGAMLKESDHDRAAASVTTALAEDVNFYGTNKLLQSSLQGSWEGFTKRIQPVYENIDDFSNKANIESIRSEILTAQEESLKFWLSVAATLDSLLETRKDHFATLKRSSLIVSVLLVVILLVGSVYVIGRLTKSLERYVESVSVDAEKLHHVSQTLDQAVHESSTAATQQSAAIEETVSAMEEMGSMIQSTSQNTAGTMSEAKNSSDGVKQGAIVVTQMVDSMNAIASSNERLQEIVRVIEDIKSKTKIINDIAFETKLLAFNASIEAARAGAHGRGFAVVAEEVGKLANVSNRAADEVRKLLDSSVGSVSSVISETKERVERGRDVANECAAAFGTMERSVKEITTSVEKIASATKEQEVGVRQANEAMQEMERASQSNARSSEHVSGQSSQLRLSASSLKESAMGMRSVILGRSLTLGQNFEPPTQLPRVNEPTNVEQFPTKSGKSKKAFLKSA